MAIAPGVVGIHPPAIVEHAPERVRFDHAEIGDHGHQNVLYAFVVKRAGQMVVVDHVMASVGSENHRDHVLAQ